MLSIVTHLPLLSEETIDWSRGRRTSPIYENIANALNTKGQLTSSQAGKNEADRWMLLPVALVEMVC